MYGYTYLATGTFPASACLLAINPRGELVLIQAMYDETQDEEWERETR